MVSQNIFESNNYEKICFKINLLSWFVNYVEQESKMFSLTLNRFVK